MKRLTRLTALLLLTTLLPGCGPGKPKEGDSALTQAVAPTKVPEKIWEEFDGEKAMAHVRAQVEIGPRPAGSAELEKTRELIIAELEHNGWQVSRQTFIDQTPHGPVQFANLIGRFGGKDTTQRFIICSHFDTKYYGKIRFVGANDGASSTGALMELSRVLALDPKLAEKVELVFFDGEEAFEQFSPTDGTYGSRHYASDLRAKGRNKQFRSGVLWDMIGDRNLNITLPSDSPSSVTLGILAAAEALELRKYFGFHKTPIWDDHIPLNQAGIPTIDIIDFDYPYWHTADDTLDKLSPESLRIIAAVTLYWLKEETGK